MFKKTMPHRGVRICNLTAIGALAFLLNVCAIENRSQSQLAYLNIIQKEHLKYLGAFALPKGDFGASRYGYSGRAVTPYNDPNTGKNTLFMEGHDWNSGTVGQIEIPSGLVKSKNWSDLPKATVLQNFYDIADGKWESLGTTSYNSVFGMLPYNGRLIVAATSWFDAGCQQKASHGVSSLDLSKDNDFQGFFSIDAVANPRSLGGYMTTIPAQWQQAFGGPALTGNSALSIISCISSGPAATVFNPDHIGTKNPVPGTTVVYYPLAHYLVSGGVTTENTFTFGSGVKGIAFPENSRSVLFIGTQTMADGYCYGPGTDDSTKHKEPTAGGTYCYDPCSHSKSGHGYPYIHYVWAYDANDLLKAKAGKKEPWEMMPYAAWQLTEMDTSGCAGMRGAGYDPQTRKLYITQYYGEDGRVDVYKIGDPGSSN
jgi:hypothetical protein